MFVTVCVRARVCVGVCVCVGVYVCKRVCMCARAFVCTAREKVPASHQLHATVPLYVSYYKIRLIRTVYLNTFKSCSPDAIYMSTDAAHFSWFKHAFVDV